jgi:hypothetical protein
MRSEQPKWVKKAGHEYPAECSCGFVGSHRCTNITHAEKKVSASNFSYVSESRIYNRTAYIYWWTWWKKIVLKKSPTNINNFPHTIYLLYDSEHKKFAKNFIHRIKAKIIFLRFCTNRMMKIEGTFGNEINFFYKKL